MTFKEYQQLARRTQNALLNQRDQAEHALWGMASEIGEICGLHQKTHQGHRLDRAEVKKEVGDLMWFVCEYLDVMGYTLEEVCEANIAKLRERYPQGFSAKDSIERRDVHAGVRNENQEDL